MTNLQKLRYSLSEKDYFSTAEKTTEVYKETLEEVGLDYEEEYSKDNDQIPMLEAVYTILQMLANNIEMYMKVETEFATTNAAYAYLQKRLKDIRAEIDRLKLETRYEDEYGNTSSLVSYMFYNGVQPPKQ